MHVVISRMHAGTRRTARLRRRYLAAVLSQDIPYFDTTLTSGAVISSLNAGCAAVQVHTPRLP